ncbi:tRNA (guanosine(46)-N7)-methyltransferase TrmB [Pigmentibacter ruber]|nr:hypothetical protein GTC16762_03940 [Pigmentibacter ruber]
MRKVGTIIDNLRSGEKAPDRHENPYLTEALQLSEYLLTQAELQKVFPNIFKDMQKPIVVEVGCYMGKNVIELAQGNNNMNFLGIDITYKRVVKSARKLKRFDINNGKIAICDARYLMNDLLPDQFLDGICVFFPDPWPKDRHEKNRLLNQQFIQVVYQKLKPNGFFWFKSDHLVYFTQTNDLLLKSGFVADDFDNNQPRPQPENIIGGPYETAFQKLFINKGIPFYQRVYLKI